MIKSNDSNSKDITKKYINFSFILFQLDIMDRGVIKVVSKTKYNWKNHLSPSKNHNDL